MSEEILSFMNSMGEAYKEQKRLVKSDEIITFIKENWRLFCSTRSAMKNALDMLGTQVEYTVDALCDQLGIPPNVFFKRSPVKDVTWAILDFENSPFMQMFIKCCNQSQNGEACLFVVAGLKSIIITNMQTHFNPGSMIMYFKSMGDMPDIHVFSVRDAANRMPNMFDHANE